MNRKYHLPLFLGLLLSALFYACGSQPEKTGAENPMTELVEWHQVNTVDVVAINSDIEEDKQTVDIGIYFPSNHDPDFDKVSLESVMESFLAAKEIYKPTGVQLNLLFVKTGEIDPSYLAIQANEIPGVPATEYANTYVNMRRNPSQLTDQARAAFESIVEPAQDNSKTVYLVVLQDVFFPFLEVSEGRNWTVKSVRTGGLSFPTYSYVDQIPAPYRGVITLSNLSRGDRSRRTVAHELGHKLMNVSHEYKETHPGHEVYADGGLMLYGDGEDIPSGPEGRWHLERLMISPFLYRMEDGKKVFNPDYKEGGHYYDPIYKEKVVHFKGTPPIDPNW